MPDLMRDEVVALVQHDEAAWQAALHDSASDLVTVISGHRRIKRPWQVGHRVMAQHFLFGLEAGEAQGQLDGTPFRLQAGSLLWASPGSSHGLFPVPGRSLPRCFHIRFQLIAGGKSIGFPGSMLSHDAFQWQWLLEHIHDNMLRPQAERSARLKSLLFYLFTEMRAQCRDASTGGLDRQQCARVLRTVERSPPGSVTPAGLASAVGLSPDYFTRLFRRRFGVAPRAWLMEQRVRRAAELLHDQTARSIGSIADELGYCDVFLFSRQFKQVMGCTPSAYRRRARGG
ncbi:MAG: AraC family transcriptional regulator [Planctomycetota bacterium]|jgi:AraC-like DNA-binding protein/mannose-6-phosphate isomerase-like protein (cupin superfamily)|nr:AraC family transcriptional regulator [Planctomycetota bacterium]